MAVRSQNSKENSKSSGSIAALLFSSYCFLTQNSKENSKFVSLNTSSTPFSSPKIQKKIASVHHHLMLCCYKWLYLQNSKENSKSSHSLTSLGNLLNSSSKIQKKIASTNLYMLCTMPANKMLAKNSKENSKYLFSRLFALAMFPKPKFKRK